MMTSWTRYASSTSGRSSIRPEREEPVVRARRQRDEADHLDRGVHLVRERVRDVLDVLARAHEHRAAAVAGRAQQHARGALVEVAGDADHHDRERERAVEDVVARVLLAVDDGEHERDQHHLEEARHDPRQAGALGALRVEVAAREQQHHHEVGEGDRLARLDGRGVPGPLAVPQHRLDHQGGEDRRVEREEVQREQRHHARGAAQRLHPQQEGQQRRPLPADVDRREHDRRSPRGTLLRGPLRRRLGL